MASCQIIFKVAMCSACAYDVVPISVTLLHSLKQHSLSVSVSMAVLHLNLGHPVSQSRSPSFSM